MPYSPLISEEPLNCGALMEFACTDTIAPVFDATRGQVALPFLTPREWLVKESIWGLLGGSWLGLSVFSEDDVIEDLYRTYITARTPLPRVKYDWISPPLGLEIPNSPYWGERCGEGGKKLRGEEQLRATLDMMVRGVAGIHYVRDRNLEPVEIKVVNSPEAEIRESWARIDAWRDIQREYLYADSDAVREGDSS